MFAQYLNPLMPGGNKKVKHTWLSMYDLSVTTRHCSPRVSPRQSVIARGFCRGRQCFSVITSAKILPRWLFPSNIYIQFTIFNIYFSTKLSFTNKWYHLHMLEKCLYVLQKVKSMIYFRQLIQPFFLRSRDNGTSFAFTSYIIVSAKFCDVLQFLHLQVPLKNKTFDINDELFINFSFEVSFF